MARFNKKEKATVTKNLAGGQAYKQTEKLEFASILLTSFVQNQFYRSADETVDRLKELLEGLADKRFAAKAAIYARKEFGMRSVTHVVGGEIARLVKGEKWTKSFFERVVNRTDDITETLSYYFSNYGKPLPNSMKKGFAAALEKMDEYQLAKYKGEGKAVSLIDAVNLLRPHGTEALNALMKGTLKPADTWETKLTQAGQKAETDEEKEELKNAAWKDLIQNKKLGYFALLRNLRNIVEQAPDILDEALAQLVNPQAIKKSLVLPFRYLSAIYELMKLSGPNARKVVEAIALATEIAVDNVPILPGRTLIALDNSGSMFNGERPPFSIGALFAAALYKKNADADLLIFNDNAQYLNVNGRDSIDSIVQRIKNIEQGGTNFHCIFQTADKAYDRVIILSDMQGWVGYNAPTSTFNDFSRRVGKQPTVYSIDLAGHGTMQLPQDKVYCLAGFSDKIFDIMKLLEEDRNALVHAIEAVEL